MKKVLLYTLAAVSGLVAIGMAVNAAGVVSGTADTESQMAYDAGVVFADSVGVEAGCETLREYKGKVDYLVADGRNEDAAALASALHDGLDGALLEEVDNQRIGSEAPYFISGFWDILNAACPDAFQDPYFAGRP